jgi:hypothetical protein
VRTIRNTQIIYKDSVRTSQETHYVSATKANRLMLFRETVDVYCENHTEHTDTLCKQDAEFWCVKAGGTYSNHWAFKSIKKYLFMFVVYLTPLFASQTIRRRMIG